jgi:hypothetical protein
VIIVLFDKQKLMGLAGTVVHLENPKRTGSQVNSSQDQLTKGLLSSNSFLCILNENKKH